MTQPMRGEGRETQSREKRCDGATVQANGTSRLMALDEVETSRARESQGLPPDSRSREKLTAVTGMT